MGRKPKELYLTSKKGEISIITPYSDILDIIPTDSFTILKEDSTKSTNFFDYYNDNIKKIRLFQIIILILYQKMNLTTCKP